MAIVMRLLSAVIVTVIVTQSAFVLGCFSPTLPQTIGCADGVCPPGLACGTDRICRAATRDGGAEVDPDAGIVVDASSGDARVVPACVDLDLGSSLASINDSTIGKSNNWSGCDGEDSPDVAHLWTAPFAGTFSFDTCGSDRDFDTVLSFHMTCTSGASACDDDFGPCDLASRLVATLGQGESIIVVVDGIVSSGDYKLNISEE